MEVWIELIAIFLTILFLIGGVLYCLYELLMSRQYDKDNKVMFRALENVLITYHSSGDYEGCINEIDIIFRTIVTKNDMLMRQYTNIPLLLEKYILYINSENIKLVNPKVSDIHEFKKTIQRLIKEYNKKNPMEQIRGTNYVVLSQLLKYIECGEQESAYDIVSQVATELKNLQDNLYEKEKNGQRQDVLSRVGIVLSCVFGLMTFVQFFV